MEMSAAILLGVVIGFAIGFFPTRRRSPPKREGPACPHEYCTHTLPMQGLRDRSGTMYVAEDCSVCGGRVMYDNYSKGYNRLSDENSSSVEANRPARTFHESIRNPYFNRA